MKNKLPIPLIVIAVVVILGIIGVVVYATNQGSNTKKTDSSKNMDKMKDNSKSADMKAVKSDTVKIENFAFTPAHISVKIGTKVTWTNEDSIQHNVVGDSFKDLNGPLLDQGKTFSYTFKKAGDYPYHCNPHPYMKGTVTVTE